MAFKFLLLLLFVVVVVLSIIGLFVWWTKELDQLQLASFPVSLLQHMSFFPPPRQRNCCCCWPNWLCTKAIDDAHAVESLREALAERAAEYIEEPGTKLAGLSTKRKHSRMALRDLWVEGLLRWRDISRYTKVPVRLSIQTTVATNGHSKWSFSYQHETVFVFHGFPSGVLESNVERLYYFVWPCVVFLRRVSYLW